MKCGKFFDELEKSLGKFIELETSYGSVRSGKLTGLTFRRVKYNVSRVNIVTELELNGDPSDRIELSVIIKLEIS